MAQPTDLPLEERIARLASRQHGVVTRSQLRGLGITRRMVERRLSARRLVALHGGVYLVGPVAPPRAREMAAVLACAGRGFASHVTAAWLWGFGERPPDGAPVHVRVPRCVRIRRPGILAHRTSRFESSDVDRVDGIPATSAVRTLIDVAAVMDARELERAVARADRMRLVTREALVERLDRHRNAAGVHILARILSQEGGPAFTRSALEDRFGEEVSRYGLPAPRWNVVVEGYELDTWWSEARLAVELDGAEYHRSWRSQERDRRRHTDLAAAGITVLRVTWRQLVERPERTMAKVAQAFAIGRDRLLRR